MLDSPLSWTPTCFFTEGELRLERSETSQRPFIRKGPIGAGCVGVTLGSECAPAQSGRGGRKGMKGISVASLQAL